MPAFPEHTSKQLSSLQQKLNKVARSAKRIKTVSAPATGTHDSLAARQILSVTYDPVLRPEVAFP